MDLPSVCWKLFFFAWTTVLQSRVWARRIRQPLGWRCWWKVNHCSGLQLPADPKPTVSLIATLAFVRIPGVRLLATDRCHLVLFLKCTLMHPWITNKQQSQRQNIFDSFDLIILISADLSPSSDYITWHLSSEVKTAHKYNIYSNILLRKRYLRRQEKIPVLKHLCVMLGSDQDMCWYVLEKESQSLPTVEVFLYASCWAITFRWRIK